MGKWYSRLSVDTKALPLNEPFFNKLEPLFRRCVEERSGAVVTEAGDAEFEISFALDQALEAEAFQIQATARGVMISGADFNALVFGMGRFLHKSHYDEKGMQPAEWYGISAPESMMRNMYFATHFFNWYQQCEPSEMERYVEDLMLWGINTVCCTFPSINFSDDWDTPEAQQAFVLFRRSLAAAKSMNMKTSVMYGNLGSNDPDPELLADKSLLPSKAGNPICPSTEKGYAYLARQRNRYLTEAATVGFDYLIIWPYDEGGCCCEKCWPWGAKGYYDYAKRMSAEVRAQWPETKIILSTWLFGYTKDQPRDWPGFYERVQADEAAGDHWIDMILIDSQDLPCNRYVLEHGKPSERIPLIAFADICMLNQFPWGGFGATIASRQVCKAQLTYKHLTDGCVMYTEGIFDDLNKALCASLFWDSTVPMEDMIADYLGYECPGIDIQSGLQLLELIERSHEFTNVKVKRPVDLSIPEEASRLADELDRQIIPKMRTNWRWRILYIRAKLDLIRYRNCAAKGWPLKNMITGSYNFSFWGDFLEGDEEAERLMLELVHIYHAMEIYDPWKHYLHHAVRPPLRKGGNGWKEQLYY